MKLRAKKQAWGYAVVTATALVARGVLDQTVNGRCQHYLTNIIRSREDSSFWPLSSELSRSIPPDAALSMVDPSLGEQPCLAHRVVEQPLQCPAPIVVP